MGAGTGAPALKRGSSRAQPENTAHWSPSDYAWDPDTLVRGRCVQCCVLA